MTGEASDGIEAIEIMQHENPDVVIMDVNIPRLNGIDTTREILRRWPDTIVIGLSVRDEETTRKAMLDAGAKAFLPKSGDADRIITTIMSLKQHKSAP